MESYIELLDGGFIICRCSPDLVIRLTPYSKNGDMDKTYELSNENARLLIDRLHVSLANSKSITESNHKNLPPKTLIPPMIPDGYKV